MRDRRAEFSRSHGRRMPLAVAAYAIVVGDQLQMRAISFLAGRPQRAEGSRSVLEPLELGQALARAVGG